MKQVKPYLLAAVVSLVTAPSYGNPGDTIHCISDEMQHGISTLTSLKQIFETVARGWGFWEEDFTSLVSGECFVENERYDENRHRLLINFRYKNTPFGLILKRNRAVLCHKNSGYSLDILWDAEGGKITICVLSGEKRLMRYVHEHYDIFAKHLYELLGEHIQTEANADPFAIRVHNAFEQSGYVRMQSVQEVLPFAINAENMYMFIAKRCMKESRKGKTLGTIAIDMQPLCNILIDGAKSLCPRVLELFKSTAFSFRKRHGVFKWHVKFPEIEGKKCLILETKGNQKRRKNVFIVTINYLALPFLITLERDKRTPRVKEMAYDGYDRIAVEYHPVK